MLAIEARGIHKDFRIPHEVYTTLTERVLSLFRPVSYERFHAVRGVDLEIEKGSFVGIIGGNGSGKSTLLKVVSGLLLPDAGEVRVNGSMSALLELGLGFSPELSVRENVELYAAVLGYPRREQKRRVDEAIEFAGLERFRDAKLKNLSTGMRARLGFSTALQAESDIMLLDEILAVGDADFQLKCLQVFEDLKRKEQTMVLVSHDLGQVRRFCDRVVWLDSGQVAADGEPDSVIAQYLKAVGLDQGAGVAPGVQRSGDGRMRVLRGWLEDPSGKRIHRVRSGEWNVVVVLAEALRDTEAPILGIAVKGQSGEVLSSINTAWLEQRTERVRSGQVVEVRVRFLAALRNGAYQIQVGIGESRMNGFHDLVEGVVQFVVDGSACRHGFADLQGQLTYRLLDRAELTKLEDLQLDGPRQPGGAAS